MGGGVSPTVAGLIYICVIAALLAVTVRYF